ncbi:PTS system mannose/fructose/N-acetylgalactosamine-transporter subunit IIB [Breznakia pachnodae]|uniref:PTS system mannose-specific IIB component n=1 Tax=Breznakia pachnodae TaxID=265178 RepID=A0ABU0DZW7_9FIRM|nr:PTS sugar transporter subunit IIB [Breznakia pachnodae]MDQ0360175.1 PTS system mannose-specific IIB component [Breznakia pachnodae]
MAIVHARVDERLIHGQVAMVWTNTVGATRIAVVNDEAVKDEMIISALKISKPAGVKLSILSKKRAVEKFAAGDFDGDKVFLITKTISDMNDLVKNGLTELKAVNVGNVAKRDGAVQIKKSVHVTQQDIQDIREMIDAGVKVTAQMVPNESDQSIINYLPK